MKLQFILSIKQIQLSKCEDLIGFIKRFMNQATSRPVIKGHSQGLYKMKDFYKKKSGARELVTKGKRIILGSEHIFFEQKGKGSCHADWEIERAHVGHREVPPDKLHYWCLTRDFQSSRLRLCSGRVRLQLDQVLNLGLVSQVFSMSNAILGLQISL